jgi:subtilisin family serine protease
MLSKNLILAISVVSKKFIVTFENSSNNDLSASQVKDFSVNEYFNIKDSFSIGNLKGFVVDYPQFPVELYTKYPGVKTVEEDKEVSINYVANDNFFEREPFFDYYGNSGFVFEENEDNIDSMAFLLQENPTWGLDRSDQRLGTLNKKYYHHVSGGQGVDVYVVDTGIDIKHPEFENRAVWGTNTVDILNTDCNGHGTHVAGTVGSKTFGIAKKTTLIAVKTLDCRGSGSFSGIVKGLEYIVNNRRSRGGKTSVVNMSLGGPSSSTINSAVRQLIAAGIHVVVAAGNENSDACNTSPASESSVVTVGATTSRNTMAGFSNWGTCVDILAPGENILSTTVGGRSGVMSGTSMACPHVAGAFALILSTSQERMSMSPSQFRQVVESGCTKDAIQQMKSNTVNCLLYTLV